MKAILPLLFFVVLVSGSCSEESSSEIVMYGGAPSGLIVRSEPSTSGEKLGLVPLGEKVTVLEQKEPALTIQGKTGRWTRIDHRGTEGWVFGGFLLANPPQKVEAEEKTEPTFKVIQVTQGDHACYIDMKPTAGGPEISLEASFEICEQSYVGKTVTYKTEKTKILADSCEGDMECPDRKEVDLVVSFEIVK